MTLYGLLASLAWTALAVLLVSRLDRFGHRWLTQADVSTQSTVVEVPNDLLGLAMGETEKWAQDATLDVIRQRYETYKDWNKVRAAMGIGAID